MSLLSRLAGAAGTLLLLAGAGALVQPASASVSAWRLPGCFAPHLRVARAGTEGAAGHRYAKFRITNTGSRPCRLFGYPAFRYRDASGHPVGHSSRPAGVGAHIVRLAAGQHTRVTLGYVVPDVTLPRQCHATRVHAVALRLAYRPHVYVLKLAARVCLTRKYRPSSYPVGF